MAAIRVSDAPALKDIPAAALTFLIRPILHVADIDKRALADMFPNVPDPTRLKFILL
jgi:hypothetical protein